MAQREASACAFAYVRERGLSFVWWRRGLSLWTLKDRVFNLTALRIRAASQLVSYSNFG